MHHGLRGDGRPCTLPHMARLRSAYLMRHGPFLLYSCVLEQLFCRKLTAVQGETTHNRIRSTLSISDRRFDDQIREKD